MPSKTTLAIAVAFAASASVLAAPANYYGYSDLVERDYNDYADLEARFYDYEVEDLAARDDTVADPNASVATQQAPVSPTVDTPPASAVVPHRHHRHPHHHHHHPHPPRRAATMRRRDLEDLDYFYARDDTVADPNAAAASQSVPTTPTTETPPPSAGVSSGFPHHRHHRHPHHPHHHHPLRRAATMRRRDLEDVELDARSLLSLFGIHHEAKLSDAEHTRLEGMEKDCEAVTDKKKKKKCEKQVKKIKGLEKRLKYLNEAWEKETGKPLPPHAHSTGASSSASATPATASSSSSSPPASN